MELDQDYYIRELAADHCVRRFRLDGQDNQPLAGFLKGSAHAFHANNICKTFVAVLPPSSDEEPAKVIGFITLACSDINLNGAYLIQDCPRADHYPAMPALKIARLATDYRYAGKGIGKQLINLSISLAVEHVGRAAGCRFLTTDAKRGAVTFYERLGFTLLQSDDNLQREAPVMFIDLNTMANLDEDTAILVETPSEEQAVPA